MSNLNIYGMYAANGNAVGFFVRRDSWAHSTFAKVLSIHGQTSGPLPGKPPYHTNWPHHGNPVVLVDFYFNDRLKEKGMILSCPGTYAYRQIPSPLAGGSDV